MKYGAEKNSEPEWSRPDKLMENNRNTRIKNPDIGYIIGAALVINLLCAAVAGLTIPFVLTRLKIDPAHAGTVILTTVTDVVGFLVFLGLGTAFLL